ncbi:unnamed protein product, partial [Musa acuminata subsp. burmannicoides]
GSDKSSDDPSFESMLVSTQWVNDDVATIFVVNITTATTICADANVQRETRDNEVDDALLIEASG